MVRHPRGTRAALNVLAASNGLLQGQIYFITDEDRIAVASSANTYTTFAKQSEGSSASVDPLDLTSTVVSAPAANTVRLFRRDIGGRQMPSFVGPSNQDTPIQPFLASNKIRRYNAAGSGTVVGVDGFLNPTTVGTTTARFFTTTNMFTRMGRIGYLSAATANAVAVLRSSEAVFTTGTGTNLGGFHYLVRFGYSQLTADARSFAGLRPQAAPANVDPATIVNCIGIGRRSTDTNMQLFSGGTTAQPPLDLGANFPANTTNIDMYELCMFAPPNQTGLVNWKVTRLNTGHIASGILTGAAAVVPAATVGMAPSIFISNNTTAASVAFDFVSLYVETDY